MSQTVPLPPLHWKLAYTLHRHHHRRLLLRCAPQLRKPTKHFAQRCSDAGRRGWQLRSCAGTAGKFERLHVRPHCRQVRKAPPCPRAGGCYAEAAGGACGTLIAIRRSQLPGSKEYRQGLDEARHALRAAPPTRPESDACGKFPPHHYPFPPPRTPGGARLLAWKNILPRLASWLFTRGQTFLKKEIFLT